MGLIRFGCANKKRFVQREFLKGLKPLVIQRVALLISICYLMNPLLKPLTNLAHAVTHSLETPNSIITHHTLTTAHQQHGHEDRYINDVQHQHIFENIINAFFEASSTSGSSEDSIATITQLDKHLTVYQLNLKRSTIEDIQQEIYGYAYQLPHPFVDNIYPPPK